jgi:formylglycine-generating enzyme required for sulfatase activity
MVGFIFRLCIFFFLSFSLFAQNRGMKPVELNLDGKPTTLYQNSYALLIGVADYNNGWSQLPGVKEEISTVKNALEANGFQVDVVMNPDKYALDKSFTDFITRCGQAIDNRLLFYFAGHGYTVKTNYGEELGYIVPVDAPNPNYDLAKFQSQSMEMAQIEIYARRLQAKHAMFVFDACFSGSLFTSTRAVPAIINYKTTLPVRQFITSGSADEMVPDKSVFGEQFIRAINGEADMDKDSYVTGSELADFLQSTVVNYSRNSQHPQYGKIRSPNLDKGDFVFPLNQEESTMTSPAPVSKPYEPPPAEPRYVAPAPVVQPTTNLARSNAPPKENPPAVKSMEASLGAAEIIPLVYVEGGTFQMGDRRGGSEESYVHAVSLKSFYIGKFEVTQKQWKQITGSNPSTFTQCDDCPVERISYDDAKLFLNKLCEKTGKKYRLPTEAEWEFAARGGVKSIGYPYAGAKDVEYVAWFDDNSNKTTHLVGKKQPNELGIYDMSGNIYEWCSDYFNEKYYKLSPLYNPEGPSTGENRVIRGGSWKYNPKGLKVTHRMGIRPTARYGDVGFRVVREE